ncbi:phage antirepressor KilAC domain-containing protein [Lactococcus lactis]|uniref:phage antirepressor n=1 Tax=Lactococcus lactis TaxID=1358 RepID=UPI0025A1CEBD|nr:phage antirepressor KilAC domain-containing protein [Lactococcus lactis]MDM7651163.1 phage antirepressor KilAC domain-containing protein [Lactococcus lactis]
MNELQNIDGFNAKIYGTAENPLFLAKDIAELIEHSRASEMLKTVDDDEKLMQPILASGQNRNMWFLTEDGLYEVLMSSKKPQAKIFKKKVKEILKTIRKHGAYMTDAKAQDVISGNGLADLLLQAGNQIKQLELEKSQMKPKALFADSVSGSENTILIRDLAKILKQNGIDIGEKRLFTWLRDNGYLVKKIGSDYNSPTQRSMNLGILEFTENTHVHNSGKITVTKTPKVTGKGQIYFVNKFLQDLAS